MILIENKNINDPTINLALEEYCVRNLDVEKEDYLLFYINNPSIIIGKHQCTMEEINYEYVKRNNIQVVRRISGGGAVYHDRGNLNFSFITKYSEDRINNFTNFTKPVIEALKSLGVNAELTGRNDIVVEGRKISGNAQFSNMSAMFSHGTLLFNSCLEDVVQALNVDINKIESKGIKSIRSRVANISEYLKENMTIEEFKEVLIRSIFQDVTNIPMYVLSEDEWEKVIELSNHKYRNWDWNFGRSPEFNIQKKKRFDIGQIDIRLNIKEGNIDELKIYGDFLSYYDTEELEKKLIGKKYNEETIEELISEQDLKTYIGNIAKEDFIKLLFH